MERRQRQEMLVVHVYVLCTLHHINGMKNASSLKRIVMIHRELKGVLLLQTIEKKNYFLTLKRKKKSNLNDSAFHIYGGRLI